MNVRYWRKRPVSSNTKAEESSLSGLDDIADVRDPFYRIGMPIDAQQMEQAQAELRVVTAKLRTSILEGRLTGSELILGCRQVLNLWVNGGGSSLDDPIIGFTGIESQSDHVLGGSQVRVGRDVDRMRFEPGSKAEEQEVEEIGRFFDESFKRIVEELAAHLNGS